MRADLYAALAEALAEPPEWLAEPGRAWPLTAAVGQLPADAAAARWWPVLAEIPAETSAARRARYARLFEGANGPPRFWLYESAAQTGRILGPQTAAVAAVYRAAGVTPALGAELPDHAAIELAFLAHLAERAAADPAQAAGWRLAERQFLQQHGAWLIALGLGLATDGDAVYAPIGALLADWLSDLTSGPSPMRGEENLTPFPHREGSGGVRRDLAPAAPVRLRDEFRVTGRGRGLLPVIVQAEACILCGFCVQVCPTRALRVDEDARETRLMLDSTACTGCGRCIRTCEPRALQMGSFKWEESKGGVLRHSPRAVCPACGAPTVSQAELAFITARLDDRPAWLDYCPTCRSKYYGA